jgi:uncharacterized protein YktA (UPF0223 family)
VLRMAVGMLANVAMELGVGMEQLVKEDTRFKRVVRTKVAECCFRA